MKREVSHVLAGLIVVLRTIGKLIFSPYTTMRTLAQSWDVYQVGVLWGFVYIYFLYASAIKFHVTTPPAIFWNSVQSFGYFLITTALLVLFFVGLRCTMLWIGQGREGSKRGWHDFINSLMMVLSYSLVPTLIWFFVTSTLFVLFPPPRYPTMLGNFFSLTFIIFSLTLLLWRIVMLYLTVRFMFKMQFYGILMVMVLLCMWFLPYTVLMYRLGLARVPFL